MQHLVLTWETAGHEIKASSCVSSAVAVVLNWLIWRNTRCLVTDIRLICCPCNCFMRVALETEFDRCMDMLIWGCCRCSISAKFQWCILAIFVHKNRYESGCVLWWLTVLVTQVCTQFDVIQFFITIFFFIVWVSCYCWSQWSGDLITLYHVLLFIHLWDLNTGHTQGKQQS